MEIITSFTALNLEPGNLPKEASQLRQGDFQSVLKALQDAYCNTASDPDAYLYETVAPENIIFGLYEPEKVLERLIAPSGKFWMAMPKDKARAPIMVI